MQWAASQAEPSPFLETLKLFFCELILQVVVVGWSLLLGSFNLFAQASQAEVVRVFILVVLQGF